MTANKIFFDPYKSHPLVLEHGWEEYLLSCSVDSLVSVTFCPDISHVRFSAPTQRSASPWRQNSKDPSLPVWLSVHLPDSKIQRNKYN